MHQNVCLIANGVDQALVKRSSHRQRRGEHGGALRQLILLDTMQALCKNADRNGLSV